jgi:hypothetical protein
MNWLLRWLRKDNSGKASRSRQNKIRPTLEALEERVTPTVTYHGGSVIPQVQVQALYYGSGWTGSPSVTPTTLDTYLNSVVKSPFMDALTRAGYGVGEGTAVAGYVDTTAPLPPITHGSHTTNNLTENVIEQEIVTQINASHLEQPTDSTLYVVYVQPNVAIQLGRSLSTGGLLGYHDDFFVRINGKFTDIRFAVIAYPGGTGPNSSITGAPSVNGATEDDLTVVTSHELAEAVTDPDFFSWYDRRLGEVGDITEGHYATLTVTSPSASYLVQQIAGQNDQALSLPTGTFLPATATLVATPGTAYWWGQQYTLTVTLTQTSPQPSGSVVFMDGDEILGTATLQLVNGKMTATLTTTLWSGAQNLKAVYNGDANYQFAYSNTQAVTVTLPSPPWHWWW